MSKQEEGDGTKMSDAQATTVAATPKLDAVQAGDFSDQSISQLLEMQQEMCLTCVDIGLKGSPTNPRKSFRNRQDALVTVRRLDAAIRAHSAGDHKMAERIIGAPTSALEELVPGTFAGLEIEELVPGTFAGLKIEKPEDGPVAEETTEDKVSPGLRRLRQSKNAEALREETLAQGQEAIKKVAAERSTKPEKEQEMTTQAKTTRKKAAATETPKASKEAKPRKAPAERSTTAARGGIALDHKITLVTSVKDNPKRAGSQAHADYALYRDGMKVSSYIEKVGDNGRARANLRWDAKQGFIKIG